ncbi:hypothetical protein M758_UG226400 [Ceratodon purpureus]|nr:hypothetical protein M758_UG226400 [Ceratodon purpureus]
MDPRILIRESVEFRDFVWESDRLRGCASVGTYNIIYEADKGTGKAHSDLSAFEILLGIVY